VVILKSPVPPPNQTNHPYVMPQSIATPVRPTLPNGQEARESRIPVSVQCLDRASQNLLAAYDALSKRLQPVSRMEPAMENKNAAPEPSTNCQLADDLNNITALLNSLVRQMESQLSILEV
jgi:hypothetical protein